MTANLLMKVCTEEQVEPNLQSLTDELFQLTSLNLEDGTHLDVSVNVFCAEDVSGYILILDVKVFNPYAPSNHSSSGSAIYRSHKEYEEAVLCGSNT